MSKRNLILAGVALIGGLCAAGAAQAQADVQWSVTIGSPGYGPVYTQPAPVYRVPAPVYRAPVYTVPRYHQPTHWDRDGDGIPNRYDTRYNPGWDRDGDGVPNRYDRHDHNPWRH